MSAWNARAEPTLFPHEADPPRLRYRLPQVPSRGNPSPGPKRVRGSSDSSLYWFRPKAPAGGADYFRFALVLTLLFGFTLTFGLAFTLTFVAFFFAGARSPLSPCPALTIVKGSSCRRSGVTHHK